MKIILLTFCCALASIAETQAQLALTNASYTATYAGTTDSVSISLNNLPALATGVNAYWDLSGISYAQTDTPYYYHISAPSPYLYADDQINVVTSFMYFHSFPFFNIDASGFKQYGETIYKRGYALSGFIAGASPTDSIIFLAQTDTFVSPYTKINFPATYNSAWSSNYLTNTFFTISYSIVYNNDIGLLRSYFVEYDSVIGWGEMRVKKPGGTSSGLIDVLQVKVSKQRTDSFFVGGTPSNPTPASPGVLSQFGLTQGSVTNTYEYRYIRPNEVTPLADVFFVSSNYDNTNVSKTIIHQQRLDDTLVTSGVVTVGNNKDISLYPNPVHMGTLFVNIPSSNNNNWCYQLVNMLGQCVNTGTLNTSNNQNTIQVSETVPGLYYLHLTNDNKEFYVKPVNILK